MLRPVHLITTSLLTNVGPLNVKQPLPVAALRDADPFILLHHAGPQPVVPGEFHGRVDPHPHRGFEPVSFVYQGSLLHRDSLGNEGAIADGEVQWITSGRGIIHSEGPSEKLLREGGQLEIIQLWINLPASKKMMEPAYQELHLDAIPEVPVLGGKGSLRLVAGTLGDVTGPAITQSPIMAAMGRFPAGSSGQIDLPPMKTALLYVLGGTLRVNNDHVVERHELVVFEDRGDSIQLDVSEDTSILLLAGEPLAEPIVAYGPFVMNTEDEIRQAYTDFRQGAMGVLAE
ncbi:MAG: pirin family protein [Candidatus Kapabacteria bacterium]|nr:pirin family protein [Candidatus Kapabacteria bacterium]